MGKGEKNGEDKKWFGRQVKRVKDARKFSERVLIRDIWELKHLGRRTVRARIYSFLRVMTLTFQGTKRNRIPLLGAALTFYSLIGLGPLVAIGIMLSSFIIDSGDDNLAVDALVDFISFAAPQTTLEVDSGVDGEAVSLAPQVEEMVNQLVQAAQSGTVGVVGSLVLFFIAIQVLSSVESSFNSIWGVSQGRKFGERIVVYWTFITMGAVLGAAGLTLITLTTISGVFEQVPFGGEVLKLVLIFSPFFIFVFITLALALFFRFIPNTKVYWGPALAGAVTVAIALYLYNWLSFVYVQRVVSTQSLYGSLGIVIVLMLGFYIFWLLVLLGGQLTYAVQNADFLTNENAWQNASEKTREVVSLGVLLLAAERFKSCQNPILSSELHNALRIPGHIVNTSIKRLCDIGYLHAVHSTTLDDQRDRAYLPSRPLDQITLADFKNSFESIGNNEGVELLRESSETIRSYLKMMELRAEGEAAQTIDELVGSLPEEIVSRLPDPGDAPARS